MIKNLLTLLVIGLVLYVIWLIVGMFIHGIILSVVGAILAIIWIIKALDIFEIKL